MKSYRKYKVSVRLKVKRRRMKKAVLLLLLAGVAVFLYFNAGRIGQWAASARAPQWLRWHVKTVRVEGLPETSAAVVRGAVNLSPGDELDSAGCAALSGELSRKFPSLKNISVERNWISRELLVRAGERAPVAVLRDGSGRDKFIDGDGTIYGQAEGESSGGLLPVVCGAKFPGAMLSKEIVELIKALNAKAESLPVKPESLAMDSRARELVVKFSDGSLVEWGEPGSAGEKVARLEQVFGQAREKFSGPVKISLKFFADGKIPAVRLPAQN